jgi:hypothetical protein
VLYALHEEFDEDLVKRIVTLRGSEPGSYKPLKDGRDLLQVEGMIVRTFSSGQAQIARTLFQQIQTSVTFSSSCLSARITARSGDRAREARAYLKPDGSHAIFEELLP